MTTYLTAKDVMSATANGPDPTRNVESAMPLVDLLPRLLDAPGRTVGVIEEGRFLGIVSETSLLEGIGRMLAPRDDTSLISIECAPEDFSASRISHAIEDAGAHLVDFWTIPTADSTLMVTLRVRLSDPSAAIHHLERYGYEVTRATGSSFADARTAAERLMSLNALLNV